MSEFEKLEKEVKGIDEEELYKETQEEEQETPQIDESYLKELQNMDLEQALYYIGLLGAQLKKAANPAAFAKSYATSTAALLKLIGFESALAQTLGEVMLDAKKRFIIGLIIIGAGLIFTPANAQNPFAAIGGENK